MSQTLSIWLVIMAALVAANLPFINHRLLAVVPVAWPKGLAVRLGELVVSAEQLVVIGATGVLCVLLFAMCAGLVRGVGFVPRWWGWRFCASAVCRATLRPGAPLRAEPPP